MTPSEALNLTGIAFQALGVTLAGRGLWRTWHQFGPAGERFIQSPEWLKRRSAAALNAIRSIRRRLLRRPQRVIVGAGSIVVGGGAINARGMVGYRALPDDVSAADAVKELDGRTRQLASMIASATERIEGETADLRVQATETARRLDDAVGRLDEQTHDVAVGGIRLEALGLFLVVVGLLLQGAVLWAHSGPGTG